MMRLNPIVSVNTRYFRPILAVTLALTAWLSTTTAFALTAINVPAKDGGEGIQKALDSLPKGGEVDLCPGTYIIHQPIILQRDNQILRGAGDSTILFLADNANCPVIVLG